MAKTNFKVNQTEINRQLARVKAGFSFFAEQVGEESANAVQKGGEVILDQAKEFAPMDTGALRESGRVFVGTRGNNEVRAVISFGGNAQVEPTQNAPFGIVDYAVLVHEDLIPSKGPINYTTPGTGPKFLSRAVEAKKKEAFETVKEEMKKGVNAAAKKTRGRFPQRGK